MPEFFANHPRRDMRAVQTWLVLISKASQRQTLTYEELQKILGYKGAGVFAQILGHILFYCSENGLPSLTSIVVKKRKGKPGAGLTRHIPDVNVEREKVFRYPWFRIVPPSADELKAVYERHNNSVSRFPA